MKIKKFQAKNFKEALRLIKKEMGDNAVILSSEEKKGIMPCVEVTAAVDYDMTEKVTKYSQYSISSNNSDRSVISDGLNDIKDMNDLNKSNNLKNSVDLNAFKEIKREIEGLKETIEEMKNNGYEMSIPHEKRRIFRYLTRMAIREELALKICCKNVNNLKDLVRIISDNIKAKEDKVIKKVIMLIGPTGVGKTTTIAKLAARAIKKGQRAALINLDTYRIGAIEQLRIYSKIMCLPLQIVSGAEEFKKSLINLKDRDVIFVDTTGRNPKDKTYINELKKILSIGIPIETHLLMSASSDDSFMINAYRYYKDLPVDYIAFTKTDEAVKFGSIYNLSSLYRKPVAYITTGQSVPQDIEFPDSIRLANMILNTGQHNEK